VDLKEHSQASASQQRHPWEISRADFFVGVAREWGGASAPVQGLDVGSGDTWLARQLVAALPNGSHFTCVDASYTAELLSQFKSETIQPLAALPAEGNFDLITLLDVVEHVEDEQKFLKDVLALAKPGALVVVSVPAYQSLFTAHDVWLGHYRRYRMGRLQEVLRDSGLRVVDSGGLFHGLLYARALGKLKELVTGRPKDQPAGVGAWGGGKFLTSSIATTLNLDWKVSELLRKAGIRIPGLSWWCVCRKP
jgi:SAM-dependent methyltransferase